MGVVLLEMGKGERMQGMESLGRGLNDPWIAEVSWSAKAGIGAGAATM